MADTAPNMSSCRDEAALQCFENATSIPLFGAFLSTLPRLVADEADLVGLPGGDPAVDAWITAADASRAATLSAVQALLATPTPDIDARALQRGGHLFLHAMLSDDAEEIAQIRAVLAARRWRFRVSAAQPEAAACNALIDAALDLLDRYLALDDACDAALQDAVDGPVFAGADLDLAAATAA